MEGHRHKVIVVGGGASGMLCAISAKRLGADVVLCERSDRPGRKILASGNGRCNLSNDNLDSSFYNPSAKNLIDSVLARFGKDDIKKFFEGLGLKLYSEDGRIFPVTNQSSSVLKILEMELKKLSIPVVLNFEVSSVSCSHSGFTVLSKSGKKILGRSLVLACGGRSYPAFGSDGNAYKIAKNFGHTIIDPVPAAVPIVVKDPLCHNLQGQRISATVKSLVGADTASQASGDLLFTKYGLSGTAVIDVSREISIAINRYKRKDVSICVDMVPFLGQVELAEEILKRIRKNIHPEDLLTGILPNKFGSALKEILKTKDPAIIVKTLKDRRFRVIETRGWNEADFTAGGVDLKEVDEDSLESKLRKGLYFAGEILDVDGKRGGYNLAWAWASGHIAGRAAANA